MRGDLLALGMIGALAALGLKQRGSRAGSFNETVDRGELWHLVLTSGEPSQQRVFTPGIPKNPMPGQDVQVPRTSWSWTPEDAFIGTHWWGLKKVSTNLHIAAYTNTVAAQVYSPTKQQVPDVQDTTEVWTIQPTRATLAFVLSREDTRAFLADAYDYVMYVNRQGADEHEYEDPRRYHWTAAVPQLREMARQALGGPE